MIPNILQWGESLAGSFHIYIPSDPIVSMHGIFTSTYAFTLQSLHLPPTINQMEEIINDIITIYGSLYIYS